MRGAALALSAALVLTFAGAGVWAKDPTKVSAADKEQARRLMDEGDRLAKAGKHAEALERYQGADNLVGVPTTAIEVARASERLGKLLEARDAYLRASRYPARDDEPKPFTDARKLADAKAEELSARIPEITLSIEGLPAGVEPSVEIDGTRLGSGAHKYPRAVNPGEHTVTVTAAGYEPASARFTIAEKERKTVGLTLQAQPSGTEPGPAADVEVGDPKAGDPKARDPEAGDGSSGGVPVAAWIGFGVGAAGLALGGITGALSLGKTAELGDSGKCDANKVCPAELQGTYDSANTLANVANVGFIVGGVGAVFGVVALFTMRGSSATTSQSGLSVQPLVGPTGAGLRGRF